MYLLLVKYITLVCFHLVQLRLFNIVFIKVMVLSHDPRRINIKIDYPLIERRFIIYVQA